MLIEDTLQGLNKELIDAEADIQAALHSMRGRVTDVKIVTHQRRDRADEHGRPGFFRQDLTIPKHIEVVQGRADQEKTTTSLNHKNWGSVINALMDVSSGCIDDGNKIALRVDTLKNVLRTMHLLQQHLMATATILPKLPDKPPKQAPTPPAATPKTPVAPTPEPPAPIIKKATTALQPTPAEGNVDVEDITTDAAARLADISFTEDLEHPEGEQGNEEEGQDGSPEDGEGDEEGNDEEPEGSWQEVE